jgi:tRNA threonylcarbamoyl adenosine modification protein YeaZ
MIIALETASTDISLALGTAAGEPLAVEGWTSDRRQGHEVLPRLLALLQRRRLTLADATAIAVGLGPGSFTGLRVGMSLAKGLALAMDLPLVGVPSLASWLAAEPGCQAALARAGAQEAYLLLRGAAEPHIVDRDGLPQRSAGAPLVAPVELAAAFGLRNVLPPHAAAGAVVRAAARRLATEPGGDDLALLEPTYLRAPRGIGQVAHVRAS